MPIVNKNVKRTTRLFFLGEVEFVDVVFMYLVAMLFYVKKLKNRTFYSNLVNNFKYLYNRAIKPDIDVSGFLKPFFEIGDISFDVETIEDKIFCVLVNEGTEHAKGFKFHLVYDDVVSWLKHKSESDIDPNDEHLAWLIALASWSDTLPRDAIGLIRYRMVENTTSNDVKYFLTGDFRYIQPVRLNEPKYWVSWCEKV